VTARRATVIGIHGKGRTQQIVFLSADARTALADYLTHERPHDVTEGATALFLSATGLSARSADGRLSPRAINLILEQLGRWYDAEVTDVTRGGVSPNRRFFYRARLGLSIQLNGRRGLPRAPGCDVAPVMAGPGVPENKC